MKEKVTIIGGGNGAFAAAADLTIRGHEVALYELPAFSSTLDEVREKGGIDLEVLPSTGLEGGFAKLSLITTDIESALHHADLVLIVVPSYSLDAIAKICALYVENRHIMTICPPNFGGSAFFWRALKQYGCQAKVAISEFESMMYATRKKTPSSVWLRGNKHHIGYSCFPSIHSDESFQRLSALYPLVKRGNIMETSANNINTTMHVALMACNAAAIQAGEDKLFYRECFTPCVQNLIAAMLQERMGINQIEGLHLLPLEEITKGWYAYQGAEGYTILEQYTSNPLFQYSKLPGTLNHRYITEDVPYGLIPIEEFLIQYDLPHTAISSVIRFINLLTGKDFYQEARTLEQMGMKGLNKEELLTYLTHGDC